MRLMVMVYVGMSAAFILPRMWAARKAAENEAGVAAVAANAIQAFV
jgi:type II secretory pathway pseudopilin PulG